MHWPFSDPPNVAVFTSKDIVEGRQWIYYVGHDEDDGAWQFHSSDGAPATDAEARVVSLRTILAIDPTIAALADLPLGWCAWRDALDKDWQRQAKSGRR